MQDFKSCAFQPISPHPQYSLNLNYKTILPQHPVKVKHFIFTKFGGSKGIEPNPLSHCLASLFLRGHTSKTHINYHNLTFSKSKAIVARGIKFLSSIDEPRSRWYFGIFDSYLTPPTAHMLAFRSFQRHYLLQILFGGS